MMAEPEICPCADGGCGNRDTTWCCACRVGDDGRLYQPEIEPEFEPEIELPNLRAMAG